MEDELTEAEYIALQPLRDKNNYRRRRVARGESVYEFDPEYSIAKMKKTSPKFREYPDGEVFPITSRFSQCPARTGSHLQLSGGRPNWCSSCKYALTES